MLAKKPILLARLQYGISNSLYECRGWRGMVPFLNGHLCFEYKALKRINFFAFSPKKTKPKTEDAADDDDDDIIEVDPNATDNKENEDDDDNVQEIDD